LIPLELGQGGVINEMMDYSIDPIFHKKFAYPENMLYI